MRIFAFTFIGLLLITFQTSVLSVLPYWLGFPDLLFILIVFAAINFEVFQGIIICLILGTVMEVFSGYFLGLYVVAYTTVFFVIRGVSAGLAIDESSQQPAITALAYLLACGIVYFFSFMLAEEGPSPWYWGEILRQVLIITILTIPFNSLYQMVLKQCDRKYERRSFFKKRFTKGNRYRPKRS